MTQGTKRLLALLLALIFCLALFPAAALAEDAGTIAPAEEPADEPAEGAGTIAPAPDPEEPEALPPEDGTEAVLASGQCGDSVYWSLSTDGVMTITGTGPMWDFEYDFENNRGDTPWAEYNEQIKQLVVAEGVTTIGAFAFNHASRLTKVSLPEGLISIWERGLASTGITEIQLPSTLKTIGECALAWSQLRSVTIPASVNKIDMFAFCECSGLSTIRFEGSAPHIGIKAFYKVTATAYYPGNDASWTEEVREDYGGTLTWEPYVLLSGACGDHAYYELNSLDGVMTITGTGPMWDFEYDFDNDRGDTPWAEYNEQIKQLVVAEGVTTIGSEAFDNCPNLEEISLPEGLTRIGEYAFQGCGFWTIELPGSLQTIGDGAFYWCENLRRVTFPASVTVIGAEAFAGCSHLWLIEFLGAAPAIDSYAFSDVEALAYYPQDKAGWTEEVLQNYGGSLNWVPMENGQCGDDVYWTLYPEDMELYIYGSGDTWDYDGISEFPGWFRDRESIRSVVICDGVTDIGENLFYRCTALEEVDFPETVTTIRSSAFEKCTALVTIEIPYGVEDVQGYAFENCTALKAVMFPSSLTHIGIRAFQYCGALERLYFKCTPPQIGGQAFSGVNATAYYYDDLTEFWNEDAFQNYGGTLTWTSAWSMYRCGPHVFWALDMDGHVDFTGVGKTDDWSSCPWGENSDKVRSVTVGEGVTTIGAWFFEECDNLTEVSLPSTLTDIGFAAFYNTGIAEIELPVGLKTIGDWAFTYTPLTEIAFPEGLETIGEYAFYDTGIAEIELAAGLKTIGHDAFTYCPITEIEFPEGLETIGHDAFRMTDLKAVRIPASVREIGTRCFIGCIYLREIRFEGGAPEIGVDAFAYNIALAYYPADDETWTEDMRQDYGGDLTWIPCRDGKPVNPFGDVKEGKFYYLPVLWAYYYDPRITSGMDESHFGPGETCTRAQVVTFLWNAAGNPEPESTANPFADVKEGKWYTKAVLWAVEKGITSGMDATHFGTNEPCTRAQVVTFLWNAAGSPEPESTVNPFTDVKEGKWYTDAVLWAYYNDPQITAGMDATHFGTNETCTRGQVVTFLWNYYGRPGKT